MKILIPNIGDFENVAVIEVLVRPGDSVAVEDSLLTLESDKATMDVPSPAAGKITAVHIKPGDKVNIGDLIAELTEESAAPAKSAAESAAPESPPKTAAAATESAAPAESVAAVAEREVRVPDIGDFKDVAVIEVLVRPGDSVAAEDSLLTLESDKATMDVPAPFGGKIAAMLVKSGDKVNIGDLIARIAPAKESVAEKSAPKAESTEKSAPQTSADSRPAETAASRPPLTPVVESDENFAKPYAGPSVRRFARELGADLQKIKGGGMRGRILKSDVQMFVKTALQQKTVAGGAPPMPPVDFAKFGEVELHPLPRIRKLTAENLRRNWLAAPHVTQCGEADITDMEDFRKSLAAEAKKNGYRMTPLAFFIRAAVMALRQFPEFNASLHEDGENVVRKKYFHIGVAVDTPHGLVVPVLRDADKKGLTDIARELAEISERARAGKLKSEEMQGGCFTISSLGGIGGSFFTPIINLPEAAIMGVSRSETRPQWNGKEFVPRLILPLSLSYDHRLIDGAAGARFMVHYASLLGDIRRLSL
ncbi:MAG: dihydrolipoyllysine-residue acetyltransferase [Gammaproteobacteria bacterium]